MAETFVDAEVVALVERERQRQSSEVSLVASENYAPKAVRDLVGSVLMNKYAEGVPGRRFYAGCSVVDDVERRAIDRCKELFGAHHVNVQPHGGSQANMAVFMAALKPGDVIMGMDLVAGGHLTHGYELNFSGLLYKNVSYGVDKNTEMIDYAAVAEQAHRVRPAMIIAGASAYSRTIHFEKFADIAHSVGALVLADIAHVAGFVACGLHPSPVASCDFVSATTHKTLRGPRGGFVMCTSKHARALDKAVMPGIQGGPFMNVIAAKAFCFANALQPEFAEYQRQTLCNAQALACALGERGYRVISGGTDNHMVIVDLRDHKVTGKEAEEALEEGGITASRSCIPYDAQKPTVGSGIRFGTAAMTARGMRETEAVALAYLVDEILRHRNNRHHLQTIRNNVEALAFKFPLAD